MAFSKRKSNLGKTIAIAVLLIILVSGVLLGGYYLYIRFVDGLKQEYETKINELKLQQYNNKRQVYIAKNKISFGTHLQKELFEVSDITSSLDRQVYMTEEDFGKFSKADILPGIPVMKYMVSDEKIQHDIRREEFNMFLLQSDLKKDDFIDLRLMYPNGEDYLVLAKKKIRDINIAQNTVWCWLDEREILTVSSAIVDAYIHKGSKLYVVIYVEPTSQKEAIPTYPANLNVMNLMASDPNIVDKAKLYLAQAVRSALDSRLAAISPETSTKVQSEVNKQITGVQGTIQKQEIENQNNPPTEQQPIQSKPSPQLQTLSKTTAAPSNDNKKGGSKGGFFN